MHCSFCLSLFSPISIFLRAITSSHPRLGVKSALLILDLIGKIVLNDPVYCRQCWDPMFSLLRRFPRQLQLQNFILRFVKVALKQLLQNELRASAAGNSGASSFDFDAGQQTLQEEEDILLQLFYQVDVEKANKIRYTLIICDNLLQFFFNIAHVIFVLVLLWFLLWFPPLFSFPSLFSISKTNLLQYMQRAYTPLHEACDRFPKLQPLLNPKTYASTLQNMSTSNTGFVTFDEFRDFAVQLGSRGGNRQDQDFQNDYEAELSSIQGMFQDVLRFVRFAIVVALE
jgi:hypothetical protein